VSIESVDDIATAEPADPVESDQARALPNVAPADADADIVMLKELPKEVGAMLIAAGVVGIVLPGPGTPAVIAGGLALWPNAFGKLEAWFGRKYPDTHKKGMKQIRRFLTDLEKRYPDSTNR
jgi:hypothetical protein